jgi:acetolactate synthase regulatory subunit
MPITTTAQPVSRGHPVVPPLRRYVLATTGGDDVLMRVIGVVRRRCGEVVTLDFHRGDRHRPPVLELAVAIDRRYGRALARQLEALVDVVAVREL